jgi:ADP-heptose:LPS heptosyltransferase
MALSDSVLVLRARGIGDLLTVVPALRGLRHAYPSSRIVLATPAALGELVEMIEVVDQLLPTPGLGTLHWAGDAPRLAVNLHGRGPESTCDLLAQDPGELITHRHPDFPDLPGPRWRPEQHEVDRWCSLLGHGGIATDPTDLALPAPRAVSPAPGAVVVHPGAAYPARRWPADRFAKVAAALHAAGLPVVVTGSAGERDLATGIARAAGLVDTAVLAGETGLARLAALVAEAALVICGDTGVGHLATALGTPSVLLFGPTPPRLWGPRGGDGRHVALWAGDIGDPRADRPERGLLLLSTDQVLAAADRLLSDQVAYG